MSKLMYDVGIVDMPATIGGEVQKYYQAWRCMLRRCYGKKELLRNKNYEGHSVDPRWHRLSDFHRWWKDNYIEGYHLDKDVLMPGNKVYSEDTCCYVPEYINSILISIKPGESGFHGVGYSELFKVWRGRVSAIDDNGKRVRLNTKGFKDIKDAAAAYAEMKKQYVTKVANQYFVDGKIPQKVHEALLGRYT